VGINRARGVAEDGLLFVQEIIEPAREGFAFYARVAVPQTEVDLLRPYLDGARYVVGRGRSRGLGAVEVAIRREGASSPDLQTRLADFQRAARAVRRFYAEQDPRIGLDTAGTLFSLTLRSPAIFERYGRPLLVPTPAMLGLPPEVRLVRAWARPETVGGWNAAAGLPRRTRLAARAGGVYLFWVPPSVDRSALMDCLNRLEVEGIGRERARGYGQVTVCAPFHVHNRLGATERSQR
jgi:CRISPR-associated protein Csx10